MGGCSGVSISPVRHGREGVGGAQVTISPVGHGGATGVAGPFQSCLLFLQDDLGQLLFHHCTRHSTCREKGNEHPGLGTDKSLL